MNRLVVAAAVAVIAVAVLVISRGGSSGQEAEPAQRTQLVAALDITPIQQELAKVRDDLVALREAVTAADGLRNDVTQAVVAGIDEAGYGPLLGPLVVSAVAFEVPDDAAGQCLWQRMSGSVGRSLRDRRQRIIVDDSKKLFSQAVGPRHIERAALAFAAAAGCQPASFRALLRDLAELAEDADAYPWYQGADFPVPLAVEPGQIEADRLLLQAEDGARFLGAWVLPVLVREFNRLVESVGTKSATLFMKTSRLLGRLWDQWGEAGLTVHVDKHGGRDRYGLLLHQTFFGARIAILEEGRDSSLYHVAQGGRQMTVGFHMHGDAHHMPVALASVYSKYVRELFMKPFNAFWAGQVPGLRPTAGYYTDGGRFLRDIEPARERLGIDPGSLIRIA